MGLGAPALIVTSRNTSGSRSRETLVSADEEASLKTFADPATQEKLAEQAAALEGRQGALLLAVSATDGKKLTKLRLASLPVFDGLAAAGGKLYLTTADGKVLCFGKP